MYLPEKKAPRRRTQELTTSRTQALIRVLTREAMDFYLHAVPGEPAELTRHEWRWVSIHQLLLRADAARPALWHCLDALCEQGLVEICGRQGGSSRGVVSLL